MSYCLPVLMYHRVEDSGRPLSVTPREFERQMAWLAAKGYQTLEATQIEAFLKGEFIPKGKVVAITFDDGYACNWYNALPVLSRHKLLALLFVVTGWLGEGIPRMQKDPGGDRDEVYLRWSEAKLMVDSGFFQLHTHTHSHKNWWELSRGIEEYWMNISRDIGESINALRSRGITSPLHLAWPWGHFEQSWIEPALQLGVSALYTTNKMTNRTGDGIKSIRRINIDGAMSQHFELALSFATNRYTGSSLNALFAARSGLISA